ncbi:lactosylceramide 4-alpha-galactosyltransferase-like [Schistocerca nitens]|uniref:lactosylceramide 4-alpha-galactosyltransferase-like n=1 Tax=Schistocerca nitens TaxID=7011 RepID=UPI0021189644|nr:lactosylceramide 4-alpha-galactosyltransferase-like [Schistocerca nitens]
MRAPCLLARRSTLAAGLALAAAAALLLTLWAAANDDAFLRSVLAGAGAAFSDVTGVGASADGIACYEHGGAASDDAAPGSVSPTADDPWALPDVGAEPAEHAGAAIFFHETSCASATDGEVTLTPRQACAVESAARANPHLAVYLLMAAAPAAANASWSRAARQLRHYGNVRLRRVSLERYVRGTPLAGWYRGGALRASRWPRSHASDVLRFLTLYKFGGTYLDLDVVVTRSLEGMSNFAGAESATDVAAGVLNFSPDGRGHALAAACLADLSQHFRGDQWGHNGPGVITRVLKRACSAKQVREMTRQACGGFTVHPPSAFYPIPWREWRLYFEERHSNRTMARLRRSYAIHVWNKFSQARNVTVGSRQPYGLIAERFCPRVYAASGKFF